MVIGCRNAMYDPPIQQGKESGKILILQPTNSEVFRKKIPEPWGNDPI